MEDPPSLPTDEQLKVVINTTTKNSPFNDPSSPSRCIYSPTDIAMDRDFSYWTSQVKYLLWKVASLDKENKQLHEEVSELKQLVFEIKKSRKCTPAKSNRFPQPPIRN